MSSSGPVRTHKRAYQACNPCRERRVRCDLGSVDSPHHGPCGRCRRERKVCEFSATRGKKKASIGSSSQHPKPRTDGSIPQLGPAVGANAAVTTSPDSAHSSSDFATSASAAAARGNSLIKADTESHHLTSAESPRQPGDQAAAALLRGAAYTSHDALSLLWEAGKHSERVRAAAAAHDSAAPENVTTNENRPPAPPRHSTEGPEDPLRPWSNLRFVRTGLFTAEEALDLVNYFHAYLAPFTPISSSSFQDPSMHSKLLEDEPILATTILMLASRYMKLSGPGAVSRSYMVHERLWQHLQGMIARMIFGQEQFTAGSNDAGGAPEANNTVSYAESALAGSSFGSLRTLGTCEALLLLSEWHPRSLHVPAGDDGDSIIVKDDFKRTMASTAGIGGRIRIDWLEPVWRSDRMCWSMLGNALALAVELGIFDEYDTTQLGAREARHDIWNCPLSSQRAYRVQHLLWVYLTQTSGRLGWKNLTNVSVSDHNHSSQHGDTIKCWVGVAALMKRGNELLFTSRERTKAIIRSGEYIAFLRILNPMLREWQRDFDRAKLSKPMRSVLTIEYGYARVYVNSVALQAIVEHFNRNAEGGAAVPISSMLNPYDGNKDYFMEVLVAARSILQTVVEDLLPDNHLKHIPIRTYSRILAGAMFCLKAIALGIKDEETALTLSLIERTAEALCTCVVDDVHLSNRFGELLQALAGSLRNRVGRMPANDPLQTGNITPSSLQAHRQHLNMQDGMMPDAPVSAVESYERMVDPPTGDNPMMGRMNYGGGETSAPDSSGVPSSDGGYPFTHMGTDQAMYQQDDPLLSFAGLGTNQLGWSGGQDFFDMLGPLLDVQYEQYR